jgi:hypothetical protein
MRSWRTVLLRSITGFRTQVGSHFRYAVKKTSAMPSGSRRLSYLRYEFLVFDHDAKYGFAVPATIESMQITPYERRLEVFGRTEWLSARLAAAAVSCPTM